VLVSADAMVVSGGVLRRIDIKAFTVLMN